MVVVVVLLVVASIAGYNRRKPSSGTPNSEPIGEQQPPAPPSPELNETAEVAEFAKKQAAEGHGLSESETEKEEGDAQRAADEAEGAIFKPIIVDPALSDQAVAKTYFDDTPAVGIEPEVAPGTKPTPPEADPRS